MSDEREGVNVNVYESIGLEVAERNAKEFVDAYVSFADYSTIRGIVIALLGAVAACLVRLSYRTAVKPAWNATGGALLGCAHRAFTKWRRGDGLFYLLSKSLEQADVSSDFSIGDDILMCPANVTFHTNLRSTPQMSKSIWRVTIDDSDVSPALTKKEWAALNELVNEKLKDHVSVVTSLARKDAVRRLLNPDENESVKYRGPWYSVAKHAAQTQPKCNWSWNEESGKWDPA